MVIIQPMIIGYAQSVKKIKT